LVDGLRDSDGRIWFTIAAPTLLPVGRAAGRLSEQSCNSCRSAGRDSVRFHLSARDCASSRCWARRPSRGTPPDRMLRSGEPTTVAAKLLVKGTRWLRPDGRPQRSRPSREV